MKAKLNGLVACYACESSLARVALHLIALATGREGLARAYAGVRREFVR